MARIEVDVPVRSATHSSFALDCRPTFQITHRETGFVFRAEFDVSNDAAILDAFRAADACLAAVCLLADSVVAREVRIPAGLTGWRFLTPPPQELAMIGGLHVVPTSELPSVNARSVETLAGRIRKRAEDDNETFAILMMYSVANGFLCQQLIRESALNYFAVVETAALMALKKGKARTSVSERELHVAATKLGVSEADHGVITKASRARNLLVHGHPDQLVITQHSLGVYPATSFSLKLPALACKAAADSFLRAMFAV